MWPRKRSDPSDFSWMGDDDAARGALREHVALQRHDTLAILTALMEAGVMTDEQAVAFLDSLGSQQRKLAANRFWRTRIPGATPEFPLMPKPPE